MLKSETLAKDEKQQSMLVSRQTVPSEEFGPVEVCASVAPPAPDHTVAYGHVPSAARPRRRGVRHGDDSELAEVAKVYRTAVRRAGRRSMRSGSTST